MKKIIGLLALGIIAMAFVLEKDTTLSQGSDGINFSSLSLEKAKQESLKSGKLIFIDAHTSWCGPCKKMAAVSFTNKEVGEIYNSKFINLKIDCEKDSDGPELARMYKVRAYPTLLIIDGNGKLVKQVVGFQTEDRLIDLANSVD